MSTVIWSSFRKSHAFPCTLLHTEPPSSSWVCKGVVQGPFCSLQLQRAMALGFAQSSDDSYYIQTKLIKIASMLHIQYTGILHTSSIINTFWRTIWMHASGCINYIRLYQPDWSMTTGKLNKGPLPPERCLTNPCQSQTPQSDWCHLVMPSTSGTHGYPMWNLKSR